MNKVSDGTTASMVARMRKAAQSARRTRPPTATEVMKTRPWVAGVGATAALYSVWASLMAWTTACHVPDNGSPKRVDEGRVSQDMSRTNDAAMIRALAAGDHPWRRVSQ